MLNKIDKIISKCLDSISKLIDFIGIAIIITVIFVAIISGLIKQII